MLDMLKNNVCSVIFEKADGSKREMHCTLMANQLPEAKEVKEDKTPRAVNEDVIPVWDIDKGSWRSFRVDSVQKMEVSL
jgi:hypothetical protein